jgi:predicted nucleotidyltransferase
MMKREEVLQTLKEHNNELKNFDVRSLSIFGSVARGTHRKTSDVDILVEFNRPIGLFEFARLKFYLEKLLQREVDLVTPDAIRKEMRETILREAIHAA